MLAEEGSRGCTWEQRFCHQLPGRIDQRAASSPGEPSLLGAGTGVLVNRSALFGQ